VYDDVAGCHESRNVGTKPHEVNAIGKSEIGNAMTERVEVLFVPIEQRIPNQECVYPGEGSESLDENMLALPSGESTKYADERGFSHPQSLPQRMG
jgi:hypothetical protein